MDEALRLREAGWSFARISFRFGASKNWVLREFERRGLHKPKRRLVPHSKDTEGHINWGYRRKYFKGEDRREHRVVMEQILGRKLLRSEAVHHKNHDRLDNRPENLEVMTRSEHQRMHMLERWADKRARERGLLFDL